jgi:hypothetical protein
VHPKVANIVLRGDKGDKEDKRDSAEKEKYICKNGMLPTPRAGRSGFTNRRHLIVGSKHPE